MYAIAFDLDTDTLQQTYAKPSWNNAYSEIRSILEARGFNHQQGSVYFGNEKVNPVTCVMAVMDLANKYPWFAPSVRDIRMLRIEEENDLKPVLSRVSPDSSGKSA